MRGKDTHLGILRTYSRLHVSEEVGRMAQRTVLSPSREGSAGRKQLAQEAEESLSSPPRPGRHFFSAVLGMEAGALHLRGERSAAELPRAAPGYPDDAGVLHKEHLGPCKFCGLHCTCSADRVA